MKGILIFVLLMFFMVLGTVNCVNITEISFKNPEFVEVYSNSTIELKSLYDSGGWAKRNDLSLVKRSNSSCYLVITKSFPFEVENLNCTVYTNNKNVLGYYGLKDRGEEVTVVFVERNKTKNISFKPEKEYSFDGNFSLKPVLNSISPFTLGSPDLKKSYVLDVNSTSVSPNESVVGADSNDRNEKFDCQNITFQVIPEDEVVSQKLVYWFKTNLEDDYFITYWITDLYGNIVKNKVTTKYLRRKTYTPRSDVVTPYMIKAGLKYKDCFVYNKTMIVFRPDLKKEDSSTYLRIENERDIGIDHQLIIEASRGDSKKRVVKVIVNGDVVQRVYLGKNALVRLYVDLEPFLNDDKLNIEVTGFGLKRKFEIGISNMSRVKKSVRNRIQENKSWQKETLTKGSNSNVRGVRKKSFLRILNYSNSSVSFEFETSLKGNLSCYVLEGRKRVSEKLFGVGNNTLTFLNFSVARTPVVLKLLCKVRPFNKSYYKYFSREFFLFDKPFSSVIKELNLKETGANNGSEGPSPVLYSYNTEMIEKGKTVFIGALSVLLVTLLIKF